MRRDRLILHPKVLSRRILRRMLELDRNVDPLSEAELEAQAQKNFRWNFTFNFLDGAFFWFGLSFASATTILPLFVSKLTPNPLAIALVAILGQASWYLPQLFAAGITESLERKKPIVINIGFWSERFPLWLLPIAALLSTVSPLAALLLFFVGYGWHGLGAGLIAPAWTELIARCFPVERRGRFFGITSFVGTGTGALGALLSGWLLTTYPFPENFAAVFAIAALSITLSWLFLAQTREPVATKRSSTRTPFFSLNKAKQIVTGDENFRHFLGARVLSALARMGSGFLTVAAVSRWDVSDGTVGLFTATLLVGQTAGNLLAGLVADRWGHKVSLEIGVVAAIITFLLAWMATTSVWYYSVFFLLGLADGIRIVSGVLIPLEFGQAEHRPSYVGISNTTVGLGNMVAPLLGGLLALHSYSMLFAVSFFGGFAALLVLHLQVIEPRNARRFLLDSPAELETENGLGSDNSNKVDD